MSPSTSWLTPEDLYLFNEGRHHRLYKKLGAHIVAEGVQFAVWAPNAKSVTVIGDFNGWNKTSHPLSAVGSSGIWSGVIPEARDGQAYKYYIVSHHNDYKVEKADPVAFCTETPPRTASIIHDLAYQWSDADWMKQRAGKQALDQPMSVYELHTGSWRRNLEDYSRPLTYAELADTLIPYLKETGFTHVEFMPLMEHPFGGSWGYQVTGYFAPSHRFGTPQDLMMLIDKLHQAGIGVIFDWVPSHFPEDEHGLNFFDGTHLFEHADPRQGFQPDWKSCVFNYGRREVQSFLISSALFWLDYFHIDALRVDAVASMLYLDYSRPAGGWIPNIHGGRENLEAIDFLRNLNTAAYASYPGIQTIAEESTAFPMVSRPVSAGGLGFGMKWDMGWMHDTLRYFQYDPVYRKHHHNEITFRSLYAFNENFMLPLSHDEVVHGKGSLIGRMPGDDWQKFANLRCLYALMWATPGKKLLFMGGEFAQWGEWNHNTSLDWHLAGFDSHRQIQAELRDLNALYRGERALQLDCDPKGFEWVDGGDAENSVMSFLRKTEDGKEFVLCVFNFTPVPREGYDVGVPRLGRWREIFNSDAAVYGGSNLGNVEKQAVQSPAHHHPFHVTLTLPPLGAVFLKWAA